MFQNGSFEVATLVFLMLTNALCALEFVMIILIVLRFINIPYRLACMNERLTSLD